MKIEDNPKSIKYYVKRFFLREAHRFSGKTVVDFPAGNGITTNILLEIGATPLPYDLFPEYFNLKNIQCKKANINTGIPLEDKQVDAIISQEGIEHFENQLAALQEFNRILKLGGSLIITTPNYSGLAGKLGYLLGESETLCKSLAANELDDIWMSDDNNAKDIYYGHLFLIGILKLRTLAKLSGFKIKKLENTRVKKTSLILLIFFYPFILIRSTLAYLRNMKKSKTYKQDIRKEVYKEIFKLSIHPRVLTNSHIFVELIKEMELEDAKKNILSKHESFGKT